MIKIECSENFRKTEKELYQDGYTRHFDWIDCKEISSLDNCNCGNEFVYKGFKKDRSYRAFGVCDVCGKYFEF